jgi:dTDP-4-amino-4,6-dideoxygalactose transaminase
MDPIINIAEKYHLIIVEDCAQSLGSSNKNRESGTLGVMGAFSFYPTKNLGAYGDAGAIITNSKRYYDKILMIRNYGQSKKFQHHCDGFNSRLDEIQAAILRVKLKYLEEWIEKRRQIAEYYDQNIKNVKPIKENRDNKHAYHLYVLKSPNRGNLLNHLKNNNIQTMIHYPIPVNNQKAFYYQKNEKFPNSKKFVNEVLSIPNHHMLMLKDVKNIVRCINEWNQ